TPSAISVRLVAASRIGIAAMRGMLGVRMPAYELGTKSQYLFDIRGMSVERLAAGIRREDIRLLVAVQMMDDAFAETSLRVTKTDDGPRPDFTTGNTAWIGRCMFLSHNGSWLARCR